MRKFDGSMRLKLLKDLSRQESSDKSLHLSLSKPTTKMEWNDDERDTRCSTVYSTRSHSSQDEHVPLSSILRDYYRSMNDSLFVEEDCYRTKKAIVKTPWIPLPVRNEHVLQNKLQNKVLSSSKKDKRDLRKHEIDIDQDSSPQESQSQQDDVVEDEEIVTSNAYDDGENHEVNDHILEHAIYRKSMYS